MGILRAAFAAIRAGFSTAAKSFRATRAEGKLRRMERAEKRPTAPTKRAERTARSKGLTERGITRETIATKTADKLFYAATKSLWKGAPKAIRDTLIMDELGVKSLDEAKDIVLNREVRKFLGKDLPANWDEMTDDERYEWLMSILAAR